MAEKKESGLKVGFPIDILDYRDGLPGIETYAFELVDNLEKNFQDRISIELYQDKGVDLGPFRDMHIAHYPVSTGFNILDTARRGKFFRNRKIDILHYFSSFSVPHRLKNYVVIMTVHDLVPLIMPDVCRDDVSGSMRNLRETASRIDKFIAVSSYTASDMVSRLGIPANKIEVVYNGVDSSFKPRITGLDDFRREEGLDFEFILHVGTIEPRKNIPILLKAFAKIKDKIPHMLVLAGKPGWGMEEVMKEISGLELENRIVMKGFISKEKLPYYYNCADLMVMPTKFEGFGIPVAEAMASGIPVIASGVSSIPEIVGEPPAAILVEPDNVEELEVKILEVISNQGLKEELKARGLERSAVFSWKKTAEETLKIYERVLKNA